MASNNKNKGKLAFINGVKAECINSIAKPENKSKYKFWCLSKAKKWDWKFKKTVGWAETFERKWR